LLWPKYSTDICAFYDKFSVATVIGMPHLYTKASVWLKARVLLSYCYRKANAARVLNVFVAHTPTYSLVLA